jgi:predicted naringenin-chalcone synthase
MLLTDFVPTSPRYVTEQRRSLDWLVAVHSDAEARAKQFDGVGRALYAAQISRALRRCGCSEEHIHRRGHSFSLDTNPLQDAGTAARTQMFSEIVDAYFAETYASEREPPDDVVHVTCTGYVSPSAAQKLVAKRDWGNVTRVTHAYHMGCYAAVPALRIAAGALATGSRRADIVHTELCSLHLDPYDHSLEQLVVHSLFADGLVRYRAVHDLGQAGLRVLAVHERIAPGSEKAMTWSVGDAGMRMTLARDVPDWIASCLRDFVLELLARAGHGLQSLSGAVVAVHPGGPRIIDVARTVLELSEAQVAASRNVLRLHGNMSSATLPHIWMRVLEDPDVAIGTPIVSLAFGPGLTVCGAVLEKR